MPNPNAQKNPSFFLPEALQGLADMGRGAVRGALAEGLGGMGDFTQSMKDVRMAGFMPAMLARGLQGPTSEELNQDLRGITPNPLTQPDRAHTARMGQTFGSIPVGAAAGSANANLAAKASNRLKSFQQTQAMMPRQPKPASEILQPKLFTNTTETLAGYAGDALNKAMLGETSGLLSKALGPVAPRKLFIGPGSQSWDEQAAFKASKMEAAKASPQEIWAKTGTFRGPDGNWRQEISDKGSVLGLSQTKGSADEILRHPELYGAYPELAGTKMNLYGTMKGAPEIKASLSGTPKEGFQVDIYEPGIKDNPRLSAIHEMQHAIQDIEGFSPGGNKSQAFLYPGFQEIKQDTLKTLRPAGGPIDPVLLNNAAAESFYYRLGGEAEARAAARRANMDEAERRATFPLESYDMLPDRTINIAPYANGGMVTGRHNDDGNGSMGADSWRADNASDGVPRMAFGGFFNAPKAPPAGSITIDPIESAPYQGINPMASGLGQQVFQNKLKQDSSDFMALQRQNRFANQGADRLARQNQLASAKTARLNALAPKLSTYVAPKAQGGLAHMAGGGLAKKAAEKAFRALPGQSFQGKSGLNMEMPKDLEKRILEITETNLILPSEALGKHEGKTLMITQADRTKVGEGFLGGPGFSGIQLTDPRYAGATWGVKTPGVGQTIIGSNRRVPEGQAIWTTMLGTPTQHKSNQMVFDRLYKEFMGGIKQEKLTPELKDTLNAKLASVVDKEGKNLFPADVDITNPRKFRKLVDTFDKRAAAADVMGGIGVGGKKGQIFDYDRIIQRTTDPALLEVPTGSLGNRLFQLSGEMMDRPDLHPAFPTILKGEDLGVSFMPAPRELLMEDYINKVLTEKGRQPGYMDWTRGYAPSQFLSEELLTKLQKAGYKKGGKIKKMQAGGIAGKLKAGATAIADNVLGKSKQTITSSIDPSTDLASRLTEQGRTSILPIPNRWFLQPEKFPQMQGLVEKVLQVNNMQRSDFPSGAFVNPRTGEILDKKVMEDVGVVIDPKTNRPIMSAKREIETDLSDRKKGSFTKSNLVRRQLYKPEGDPLLDELKFIATIEQSGMGHKYGLGTEYATPVEMFNTMTGDNPTLRPKSRGDVFGIGDIVGRVTLGSGKPHDVYESLLIAPKGSDVQGVKLSKKHGGRVKGRK